MRLLAVRVGAMGDVLHALPAIAALRRAEPACHIGWAIEPRWRALLESSDTSSKIQPPLVQTIHPVETRLWKRDPLSGTTLRSMLKLRRSLGAEAYDLCIDLQGSLRSAFIGRMTTAAMFVGPAHPREAPARLLYRQAVEVSGTHVIEQALSLVSAAIGKPLAYAPVTLPRDTAAEAWADTLLHPLAGQPFVLLVPQAGWGAKQWSAERFGALALSLAEAGFAVFVNQDGSLAGSDDALAQTALAASHGTARAAQATLPQLIALTRRAALVVAGDTGPLHLAAALERPVVALFGPTDPARNGPFRTRARVLRHPESVTDHRRHSAPERGLLQVSTDEVLRAALELLREPHSAQELRP